MPMMVIPRERNMNAFFSFHLFMLSKFSIINIYQFRKKINKGVGSLHFSAFSDLNLATHDNYQNNKED